MRDLRRPTEAYKSPIDRTAGGVGSHCGSPCVVAVRYGGGLRFSEAYFIGGNHDSLLERLGAAEVQRRVPSATYLCESSADVRALGVLPAVL